MKSIIYACLLFLLCVACKSNKKIEHQTEYSKQVFFVDKDSLKQGLFVEVDLEGDTMETAQYVDNLLQGPKKSYSKAGYVQVLEHYKKGVLHGPELSYFPNGNIETKGNYTNGKLDSVFYVYFDTGELKEKTTIRDNVENGPFEEYYKNGQIRWKGNFIDGDNEIGLLLEYDNKGKLISKMDCGKYKGTYICQTIWNIEKGTIKPTFKYEE